MLMNGSVLSGELALSKYKTPQVAEACGRDRSSVTFITSFLITRLININ